MSKFVLTITGADEDVDPMDLVALSKEYEFVEWGILFSATAAGTDRYPTKEWRSAFYDSIMSVPYKVNTSAHLCGSFVDQRLDTKDYLNTEVEMFYRRVQFNKFNDVNFKEILEYQAGTSTPVIFPYNTRTKPLIDNIQDKSRTSILFDASGGRGVVASAWPDHVKGSFMCGYAGGLTEENIESNLAQLGAIYGDSPFWVDLETGARDLENKFSIAQVERILKKASGYYGENRIQLV